MGVSPRFLTLVTAFALVIILPLLGACDSEEGADRSGQDAGDRPTVSFRDRVQGIGGDQASSGGSESTLEATLRPEFPSEAVDGDYDYDDDGLIEIRTLAQLDAVRLNPEGTGVVQEGPRDRYFAAFPGIGGSPGCPNQSCAGYELANDLDFDTNGNGEADEGDEYWNDGAGFVPLSLPEGATFDGNGYEISNLYISTDEVFAGLFEHNRGPSVTSCWPQSK